MTRILPIIVLVLLFSCRESESPTSCATSNPVEDLPWLKEQINTSASSGLADYVYLIQGTYKGETVFSFLNCCPFCRFVPQVLDCQGNVINVSISDVTDQKVIWRPAKSVCT